MSINDNPTVNRYLTTMILDDIDHALGRPTFPLKATYRNYYAIFFNSPYRWFFACSDFWQFDGLSGDMAFYSVTDLGRQALADHLKQLPDNKIFVVSYWEWSKIVTAKSRSSARYDCFRDVSDCSDISFREFLKVSSVRAYA